MKPIKIENIGKESGQSPNIKINVGTPQKISARIVDAANFRDVPSRPVGKPSLYGEARYQREKTAWVKGIIEIQEGLEDRVSTRGWCYILEVHGLQKDDFDKAEKFIAACRKEGLFPPGFFLEDTSVVSNQPDIITDDPQEYAECKIDNLFDLDQFHSRTLWDNQTHFCQMLVEKVDLVSLFRPVCKKFQIPIWNAGGWSNLSMREGIVKRFMEYPDHIPVLLYCGDYDIWGLKISDKLRKNLTVTNNTMRWIGIDELVIDRFGLNQDFIEEHNLSWINNLKTGGGKDLADPDHYSYSQEDVQWWIENVGERKCEANALVTAPEIGQELCCEAVSKYINFDALREYEQGLRQDREDALEHVKDLIRQGALNKYLTD